MATIISTKTTGGGGASITGDTSGILQLASANGTTAVTIDASQKVTFAQPIQGGLITSGTAVASTSGTSIDFTGIASWAKKVTVMFNGVSTNGVSPMQLQIGAGSVTATGYTGSSTGGSSTVATTNSSTGFLVTYINVAATSYSGIATIATLGSNVWVESGTLGGAATGVMNTSGGTLTLGGTLDRVRITTVNGTDTFDAGSINIMYEG